MKFGIHNPSWLFGSDPYNAFEEVKRKAQWCEEHGFAWFSVMDHLIQIPGVGAADEPFMEGWSTIAGLASVTSKIRLATLVSSVAYRNPALMAKMASTIDIISHGRLTFGIGAGWNQQEYNQYGYVFPEKPAVRISQLEEAVQLVTKMWTEPRATFHGKYFHIEDAILEPKPAQKPHPPIMIGGSGEQLTLRVVARYGDACNIFGGVETVKEKLQVLRRHCDAVGRNYDEIERTNLTAMLVARDEPTLHKKLQAWNAPQPFRGFAGTVSQAADLIRGYEEVGVQMFITSIFKNDRETLELLGEEVVPQFK